MLNLSYEFIYIRINIKSLLIKIFEEIISKGLKYHHGLKNKEKKHEER